MNKHLVLFAAVALAIVALIVSNWSPDQDTATTPTAADQHFPSFFIVNPQTTQYNATGKIDYILHAERAEHFQAQAHKPSDEDYTLLSQPRFRFFQESSNPWQLSAGTGELKSEDNTVTLSEQVLAIQQLDETNSAEFKTELLIIDTDDRVADTDRPISLRYPGAFFSGTGFHADFDSAEFTILEKVEGIYSPTQTSR